MEFRLYFQIVVRSFLLSLFCVATLAGQATKPTPYGILYKEWKSEKQAIDDSKPPLAAKERRARKRKLNKAYTGRFLKLAQENRHNGLWVDCLIWTTVEGIPGKDYDAMFDLMRDNATSLDDGDTHQLMLLMSELIPLESARLNPALEKISKSHPSEKLRGTALYVLAARTKREAEFAGDAAG